MTAVAANSGARPGAAPAAQLAHVDKLLGHTVTFTLGEREPRTVSGRLWAYDAALGIVALECAAAKLEPVLSSAPAAASSVAQASQASRSGKPSAAVGFCIVKVAEIKKIAVAPDASAAAEPALTPIHPVSLRTAQMREADAVRQSLTKVERTGKGVSKLGQQVFDALSKTLPCRWLATNILVMEDVLISAPGYDPESTGVNGFTRDQLQALVDGTHEGTVPPGAQAKANSWNRVVKVLQGERRKILAS